MELFSLAGKAAVVTGSTRGIGKATARRLAEHGANVVVCGRSAEAARAGAEAINAEFGAGRAVGAAFDLAGSAEPLLDVAMDAFGRLDVLVSNAAHIDVGRIDKIDAAAIEESMALNVIKNARFATAAAPLMARNGGGSILFITSIAALYANPALAAYSLAKAALHQMVGLLAHQFGPQNVRVNAIAPGLIQTDGTAFMEADTENFEKIMAQFPMRRIGKPDEIAGAVVFLGSPAGAYATGQVFVVDGGAMVAGTQAMVDSLVGIL
jgi:NAD(P)-dependent dehydrogenase (short-subunit alcohol dehydrogenase family)